MTHKERVAIARIVSDIVRADNIIDESETRLMQTFFEEGSHYRLTYEILRESREISFSCALNMIAELSNEEKLHLYDNVLQLANVDGMCDARETCLLLAMCYCLGIKEGVVVPNVYKARLFACPTNSMVLNNRYMIYLEGDYDEKYNREIANNLKLFSLTAKQWGFDFVYLPGMVSEFAKMDPSYVKSVLRYISPELTEERTEEVYERLQKMNTESFCNSILATNLKVEEVRNIKPSLLINIGTSVVPYYSTDGQVEYYTEFLAIELDESVTSALETVIQMFSSIISRGALQPQSWMEVSENKFRYFGFYKAILDFLVKAEPKVGEMVFCPRTSSIYVPVLHKEVALSPQECSVLTLIAMRSAEGYGLPSCFTTKKEMAELNRIYSKLYSHKGGVAKELPSNLAPIVSRINKKLKTELKSLDNLAAFLINNSDDGYRITAKTSRILAANTPHNALNGIELSPISAML